MYEEIILDHQELAEEILKDASLIEREIPKENLLGYLSHPNILAILGVRRTGKTVLSLQLLKNKNFIYVNFDDERLLHLKGKDLNEILKTIYKIKNPDFIIFDEIQNIEGWELFLNRLRYAKRIIITGSNSRLLSSELSTHLTGRHIDFVLLPFSFREHLKFKGFKIKRFYSTSEKAKILKEIEDYLVLGGFPERYKFGKRFIETIFNDILTKDIIKRGNIRKIDEIERFTNYLISNICGELSTEKVKKNLKLHPHTIEKWIGLLKNAFLIFTIEKFDIKLWEKVRASKKIYLIDNGIFSVVGFKISENIGRLMENLVFIELLRRKHYWNNNIEIYYYRDYNNREVDFLIKEKNEIKYLIQVTYSSSFDEIKGREWKNLLLVYDYFKKFGQKPELIIITWDYEDEKELSWFGKKGKIKFIPLWKWLLFINLNTE